MKHPILLVEDDQNDAFFFERAAVKAGLANPIKVARDGREALDYLGGLGDFADRLQNPLPCLLVLDLNLPRVHGLEVLRWLRQHEPVCTLLVVILTSSTAEADVQEAYFLGANSYLIKPGNPEKLTDMIKLLDAYWLTANQPPPGPAKLPRARR